jgi:GNAT superfamily N-acetyltransferase
MLNPLPKHALTTEIIQNCVDKVCEEAGISKVHTLQRLEEKDVPTILEIIGSSNVTLDASLCNGFSSPPLYYGITLRSVDTIITGFAIFHLSFSTWDGRMMYLTYMHVPDDSLRQDFLKILAKIATKVECSRLTWLHDSSMLTLYKEMGAETLQEILTLCMDRNDIATFVATGPNVISDVWKGPLTADVVRNTIDTVLQKANESMRSVQLCFRRARKEDIESMQRLIKGLAEFAQEPDGLQVSSAQFRLDGFESETPMYYSLLLEDSTKTVCGLAFIYFGFDARKGRYLYLEDLFFDERVRGKGGGKTIMVALAHICYLLDCGMLKWQSLDWNTPALDFYAKIGAKVQDGILTTRFANDNLQSFAKANGTAFKKSG